MNKINVALVNYLNTKPFLYGLQQSNVSNKINLIECPPALCAEYFFDGTADIALIPVGALLQEDYSLINNFGIASHGKVSSVSLFSNVPIDQIKTVYLDYQSRTSVLLVQILLRYFWKRDVEFLDALPGFENNIKGTDAALIIGDRAMKAKSQYEYLYDLGDAWKEFTGLPMVYAIWCTNKELEDAFVADFNKALKYGLDHRRDLIKSLTSNNYNLEEYFFENIQFELDQNYYMGMRLFLEKAGEFVRVGEVR